MKSFLSPKDKPDKETKPLFPPSQLDEVAGALHCTGKRKSIEDMEMAIKEAVQAECLDQQDS
jgi:hypothetical protein